MFSHLLAFLVISSGCLLGIINEKIVYEKALPLTCMGFVLFLYLFGILNKLEAGFYSLVVIVLLAYLVFAFLSVKFIRENSVSAYIGRLKRTIFTPGMIAFTVCFAILTYADYGYRVTGWDELSHWALTVKQMVMYNVLGDSKEASLVTFKSYPPAMALFQYLIQKIYLLTAAEKEMSEWRLYFAYQIFSLSILMPFTSNFNYKKLYTYLFWPVLLLSSVLIIDYTYTTLYIDFFLGLLSGAGFASVIVSFEQNSLKGQRYPYLFTVLLIAILILAKDAGLLPATLIAVAYAICALQKQGFRLSKQKIMGVGLAVLLPKLTWEISLKQNLVEKSFGAAVDISSFINVLSGKEHSYRTDVLRSFITNFTSFASKSSVRLLNYAIPPSILFLILLAFCVFVLREICKERPGMKAVTVSTGSLLLSDFVIFTVGLCIAYMFKFSVEEATGLASFGRYMGIAYITLYYFALLLLANYINEIKYSNIISLVLICSCFFTGQINTAKSFLLRQHIDTANELVEYYEPLVQKIIHKTNANDKLFFVAQDCYGFSLFYTRYQTTPRAINTTVETIGNLGASKVIPGFPIHFDTVEEWQTELMENYDYVVLYNLNDVFFENFSSAFSDQESIETWGIYQVDKESGLLY